MVRRRMALLLCGCLFVEGRHAAGIDVVRGYLEKTTRIKDARDRVAVRDLSTPSGGTDHVRPSKRRSLSSNVRRFGHW